MCDIAFTFEWYTELLRRLSRDGYDFVGFETEVDNESVLLRHDVDWSPRKSVRQAEIESDHDITATYFFLISSPFYNPMNSAVREYIDQIKRLGHNIGLHFSTHQYFGSTPDGMDGTEPSTSDLVTAINQEREILSTIVDEPIEVVSFHNPPKWTFRRSFDDFVSTYETRFFDDIAYFADSNQRWREQPPLDDGIPPKVQLLTHPVLWGEHDAFSVDRIREERDYLNKSIERHIELTDRTWEGLYGLPDS